MDASLSPECTGDAHVTLALSPVRLACPWYISVPIAACAFVAVIAGMYFVIRPMAAPHAPQPVPEASQRS